MVHTETKVLWVNRAYQVCQEQMDLRDILEKKVPLEKKVLRAQLVRRAQSDIRELVVSRGRTASEV